VTFLGFKITPDGNLVDPKTNTVMERQLLTKELRNGLVLQRVNFDEDYNTWDRYIYSYVIATGQYMMWICSCTYIGLQ